MKEGVEGMERRKEGRRGWKVREEVEEECKGGKREEGSGGKMEKKARKRGGMVR
jgi:hypothetical protein